MYVPGAYEAVAAALIVGMIFLVLIAALIGVLIVVFNKGSNPRQGWAEYERRRLGKAEFSAEFSDKSRSTAGYLGIFLGSIGAHRFYLGYYGRGVLQIAVTFFTLVGGLWGMYEGMTILWGSEWRDSQGRLLRPSTK